jgi:hypothetical protein
MCVGPYWKRLNGQKLHFKRYRCFGSRHDSCQEAADFRQAFFIGSDANSVVSEAMPLLSFDGTIGTDAVQGSLFALCYGCGTEGIVQ